MIGPEKANCYNRICGNQVSMAVGIYNVVAKACNLPPMPLVAVKVMKAVMDPETSGELLAKIISSDSILVSRILKVANSAFYGCTRSIKTLQMAINILGFKTIKNMVIALSSKSMYSNTNPAEKFLWEHSLSTALATQLLWSNIETQQSEDIFICGLLHDIGKVILIDQNPHSYGYVLSDLIKAAESSIGYEKEHFGFTHAEVGGALCRSWKLPEELEGAIKFHHSMAIDRLVELEPYMGKLSAIVALADALSNKLHFGAKLPLQQFQATVDPICGVFNISRETLHEYTTQIRDLLNREKMLFKM
jgi:putative nucleotidyltransferase with HDIG domain